METAAAAVVVVATAADADDSVDACAPNVHNYFRDSHSKYSPPRTGRPRPSRHGWAVCQRRVHWWSA